MASYGMRAGYCRYEAERLREVRGRGQGPLFARQWRNSVRILNFCALTRTWTCTDARGRGSGRGRRGTRCITRSGLGRAFSPCKYSLSSSFSSSARVRHSGNAKRRREASSDEKVGWQRAPRGIVSSEHAWTIDTEWSEVQRTFQGSARPRMGRRSRSISMCVCRVVERGWGDAPVSTDDPLPGHDFNSFWGDGSSRALARFPS
ncbi:hypothetical protein K466DRAFT_161452 [Polyporus arcularius HHB13444]|uniref:Uncharacterized protein n=1 Tax=Polyporus arcularius HHB13444 TaxID=1314778 RepID=A0A5C3PYF7_9APHY|nr:hypothetical protein K466DRAFT_161452 [Polyporus arcularius HHB13444]